MKKNIGPRFPWIALGTWNGKSTWLFVLNRIYINGYKWTPFVWVSSRHLLRRHVRKVEAAGGLNVSEGEA